jgi:signal transduction histidine kinase
MANDALNPFTDELTQLCLLVDQALQRQNELSQQIAETQQIGESLCRDNQQLRALLNGMFDGYLVLDHQWRVLAAHLPLASEIANPPTESDLLGRVLWDVFPAVVDTPGYRDLQRALHEKVSVEFEGLYPPWNRWFAVRGRPFGDSFHICFHDITDRKRADEERASVERRLAEAKKWESLAALAGGLAHDFNNLLSAIMGHSGLARLDLPADSPARLHLEGIEAAGRRAALLTNQLLAYAGKAHFVLSPVELNSVVIEAVERFRGRIAANIELQLDLAANLPAILADAEQLRQVVSDLLANAAEAIGGKAGGAISVRTALRHADGALPAQTCWAENLAEGHYIVLQVADNGCGMDPATLTRMFDPFFSTKFTGRGLGLAAVLGTVRTHGGALRVESAPDRGATIELWLPPAALPADKEP